MKLNLALIFSILLASGLVSFGFTFYQITSERSKLKGELEDKIADVIRLTYRGNKSFFDSVTEQNIEKFSNMMGTKYGLKGIAIFTGERGFICPEELIGLKDESIDYASQATAGDTAFGNFNRLEGKSVYQFIQPIREGDIVSRAVVLYNDAAYIDNIIGDIWFRNFFRWFFQAFIVAAITVLIIRYGVFSPLNRIVDWIRAARMGDVDGLGQDPPARFLAPLHSEVLHIAKAMQEARATAEEEARLRNNAAALWTPERLKIEMQHVLHKRQMVLISNREPYMHIKDGKEIKCIVPASGMITAMEPILKACGGLWIASASGDADHLVVDGQHKIAVPPDEPKYMLKRIWLNENEEKHYYYGFSNEGLWPLCHIAHTRPTFRKQDWDYYQKVNERFADTVVAETQGEESPLILIQDYHFALLPELIRSQKPKARIAIFWHIPWPNPESFGICPWQKEILKGMLGADLIGFHTQYHCNHFLETVNNALESRILWDRFSVKISERQTFVKPFPISIDFTSREYHREQSKPDISHILKANGSADSEIFAIGVDRLDYTKGIVEKFLAVELFLEKHPEYQGRFSLLQVGAPSRELLKTYADITLAIVEEAERINNKFKRKNWKPIVLLKKHHDHSEIRPLYAAANFCMVTSLHDGMNLVAKEYVAERYENDGALILSRFAGAAQQMKGAIVVNPYDIDETSDAIKLALEMPEQEQQQRMMSMRQSVMENNVYAWAADLLRAVAEIK